jgi:N-acetylmuramoyl-L-alanine amidase CwlA
MCLESDWSIAEVTLKRTIWLTQKLMAEYDIPIENVLRHYDVI